MAISRWLGDISSRGELRDAMMRQQHNLLCQTLPFLYLVLAFGTAVFSFVFWNDMPLLFSIVMPAVMLSFFAMRIVHWGRYYWYDIKPSIKTIKADIKGVAIISPLLSLGYVGFILSYLWQGHIEHVTVVIFVVWTIAMVSSYCLNALPVASVMVISVTSIMIYVTCLLIGDPLLVRVSTIFVVLSLLIVNVNRIIYRTFVDNVVARWKLARKNVIAEKAREFATRIAYSDVLTGLPNRRSFNEHLKVNIDLLARKKIAPFGVAIIDLDGFKPVNDIHGHSIGDGVLEEVGERLIEELGNEGFVARLGGDEFAIIADEIMSVEAAASLGERLCDSLRTPFHVDSVVAHLSSSCGFCLVKEGRANPSCVIERADLALYKAKKNNRGGTEIYSDDLAELAMSRSVTEQALRRAIMNDTIEMHFQPIVDLADGRIVGMEALARWHDCDLGMVSPAKFIPIAEQTGLIAELTENLFLKAINAAKSWPDDIFLAFNLSAEHLTRPSVGLKILSTMLHLGFDPKRLEIEVTETAIMRDVQRARTTITNLKQAGVSIALDDFGAGYSSLGQIRDLPFDKIKIDKSFIDGVCTSSRTRSLILSIIDMCTHLGIRCVAEGIETVDQHDQLVELGCKTGQGFLFAKSMTPEECIVVLTRDTQNSQNISAK